MCAVAQNYISVRRLIGSKEIWKVTGIMLEIAIQRDERQKAVLNGECESFSQRISFPAVDIVMQNNASTPASDCPRIIIRTIIDHNNLIQRDELARSANHFSDGLLRIEGRNDCANISH